MHGASNRRCDPSPVPHERRILQCASVELSRDMIREVAQPALFEPSLRILEVDFKVKCGVVGHPPSRKLSSPSTTGRSRAKATLRSTDHALEHDKLRRQGRSGVYDDVVRCWVPWGSCSIVVFAEDVDVVTASGHARGGDGWCARVRCGCRNRHSREVYTALRWVR
jgi:hypothetical protein